VALTLVDTSILLDVVTDDPEWADWSIHHLDAALHNGQLAINNVIYGELSARFATIEALDAALTGTGIVVVAIPRSAAFLATRTYQRYRQAGGTRTAGLPEFIIGAHASVMGLSLLSRSVHLYREYFPNVDLICP